MNFNADSKILYKITKPHSKVGLDTYLLLRYLTDLLLESPLRSKSMQKKIC